MADKEIVDVRKKYMRALNEEGIHADRAILFGSYAKGEAHEWSAIDVLIIAPEFDDLKDRGPIKKMWRATRHADNRLEPIACGLREWQAGNGRPIVDIARQEGIEITAR